MRCRTGRAFPSSARPQSASRRSLFFEYFLEFRIDGKPLEHADVGSAGVADRNRADGGSERTENDASCLAQDFRRGPARDADAKHEPMSLNVRDNVTLPQDMGAL